MSSSTWVALVVLPSAIFLACGQSHDCRDGESGVRGCATVSDLSDTEITAFCEWEVGLHGDPGLRVCTTPEGGTYSVPYRDEAGCRRRFELWRDESCELTVLEEEACLRALIGDPCNASDPVCQARPPCPPSTGDAGP